MKLFTLPVTKGGKYMENIEEYIQKEIRKNRHMINHNYLYSFRNIIIKLLIKSGIILDYSYPYILSTLIMLNSSYFTNNKPFLSTEDAMTINEYIYSNNQKTSIISDKENFLSDKDIITYESPSMYIDNKYLSQKITFLGDNKYLKEHNINSILEMNYEQLRSVFKIYDLENNYSDIPKDNEAIITIIYHDTTLVDKIRKENDLNTFLFVLLVALEGLGIHKIDKIIFKNSIKNKLNELDNNPIIIGKNEIYRLNEIIRNEKNNLEFITKNNEDKPKLRVK